MDLKDFRLGLLPWSVSPRLAIEAALVVALALSFMHSGALKQRLKAERAQHGEYIARVTAAAVAQSAEALGMKVIGIDPEITVEAAWRLPSQVRKATSIEEVLKHCDFVSLHVPLLPGTKNLINAERVKGMKKGCVLLNFSRDGIVDTQAVIDGLNANRLQAYICDFPSNLMRQHPRAVAIPHLGASTEEAEENCAVMVAEQVADYLTNGNILNSVNFPNISMPRGSRFRLAIANANVPNMLGQISTALASAGLNINNMMNKSRGELAFTLVDIETEVPQAVIDQLAAIHGVLRVRYLPG